MSSRGVLWTVFVGTEAHFHCQSVIRCSQFPAEGGITAPMLQMGRLRTWSHTAGKLGDGLSPTFPNS